MKMAATIATVEVLYLRASRPTPKVAPASAGVMEKVECFPRTIFRPLRSSVSADIW
jgi:hypothetical protein